MNEAWLRLHFITKGESIEHLASVCGVSTNTIRAQLKKRGLIK